MASTSSPVKQRNITKVVKGLMAAGVKYVKIECKPDGTIIGMSVPRPVEGDTEDDWKDVR